LLLEHHELHLVILQSVIICGGRAGSRTSHFVLLYRLRPCTLLHLLLLHLLLLHLLLYRLLPWTHLHLLLLLLLMTSRYLRCPLLSLSHHNKPLPLRCV